MTVDRVHHHLGRQVFEAVEAMAASYRDSIGMDPIDHYVSGYLDLRGHFNALWQATSHLGLGPDSMLLEVGSGIGTRALMANALYRCKVVGIEPAQKAYAPLVRAIPAFRSANPSYHYEPLARTGEATGLPEGSVDAVVCFEVLEHVADPAAVLTEMRRVLRPGGRAVISTANYCSFYEGHYRIPWFPAMPRGLARAWIRLRGGNPDFLSEINFITWRRFRRLALQAGFKVVPRWPAPVAPRPDFSAMIDQGSGSSREFRSHPTWLQDAIQRRIPQRFLSLLGMHYKIYAELIPC